MRLTKRTVMLCLGIFSLAAGVLAAPRLTIPETDFDFGYSPQNSAIGHIFWLHSTGDDTLKIVKVTPGCGCTETPLQKDRLAAGDSTQLEVIFNTGRYSNQVTKTPRISTNEGPPDKLVRITTYVQPRPDSSYPVLITPQTVDLFQSGRKPLETASFSIKNVSPQKLVPTLIYAPEEYLEIVLPKEIAAGNSASGTVKVRKEFLDKAYGKSFTIQFNDEKKSRFTVPVVSTPIATPAVIEKPGAIVPAGQH